MRRLRGTHITSTGPAYPVDPRSPKRGEIWGDRKGRRVVIHGEAHPPWMTVVYKGSRQVGRGHATQAVAHLDSFLKRFTKEAAS